MSLKRDEAAEILGISRAALDRALPAVDAVVFSDPGAEFPRTYANVAAAAAECEKAGVRFEVVRKAGENILGWLERLGNLPLLPGAGHICSLKFKAEVLHKWAETEWPAAVFTWSIGIEANEDHRRFPSKPGARHDCRHPLIDLGMTRADCERMIAALGWPLEVVKSSCFFCPFQSAAEIRDLHDNHPDLWRICAEIEARFAVTSERKHAAWLAAVAAGETDPDKRAPVGQWRRDAWKEGARLFAKSIDGRRLSIAEWSARFAAEDRAAAARDEDAGGLVVTVPVGRPLPAAHTPRIKKGLTAVLYTVYKMDILTSDARHSSTRKQGQHDMSGFIKISDHLNMMGEAGQLRRTVSLHRLTRDERAGFFARNGALFINQVCGSARLVKRGCEPAAASAAFAVRPIYIVGYDQAGREIYRLRSCDRSAGFRIHALARLWRKAGFFLTDAAGDDADLDRAAGSLAEAETILAELRHASAPQSCAA